MAQIRQGAASVLTACSPRRALLQLSLPACLTETPPHTVLISVMFEPPPPALPSSSCNVQDEDTRKQTMALVDAGDTDALAAAFGTRIAFGTAGLRAAMTTG